MNLAFSKCATELFELNDHNMCEITENCVALFLPPCLPHLIPGYLQVHRTIPATSPLPLDCKLSNAYYIVSLISLYSICYCITDDIAESDINVAIN